MTQYQQIVEAVWKIGGSGTLDEICKAIDGFEHWTAKNPRALVSSYLSKSEDFKNERKIWGRKSKMSRFLYCSGGNIATAIAERNREKGLWILYGVSKVLGWGHADFEKVLFRTAFDAFIPYCSDSGLSYIAVKQNGLWGLVRFRENPEYTANPAFYQEAIGSEPIDTKSMDPLGREIKMVEEIKYSDINLIKTKYNLDAPTGY